MKRTAQNVYRMFFAGIALAFISLCYLAPKHNKGASIVERKSK